MRYAIVLGGGRSKRMGTDKMAVTVAGRTLLERTVGAALTWADHVVVAAPEPLNWAHNPRVRFTLEEPPFGGPVAGIKSALDLMGPVGEVLVLAGDLANPDAVVAALTHLGMGEDDASGAYQRYTSGVGEGDVFDGADALVLEDTEGWPQYLAGRYVLPQLRDAAGEHAGANMSVRSLMKGLRLRRISAPHSVTADLDTPEDLRGTLGLTHP